MLNELQTRSLTIWHSHAKFILYLLFVRTCFISLALPLSRASTAVHSFCVLGRLCFVEHKKQIFIAFSRRHTYYIDIYAD